MRMIFCIILQVLIVSCGSKEKQQNQKENVSLIKDTLTQKIQNINAQGSIVGFSVAMVDSTGILYNEGFGFSDKMSKQKYTTNTNQYVASISKTLIGISLLKAQELGVLNLDDSINTYLPFKVSNPNHQESVITIRQLAIHTSSIVDSDIFWENNYILLNNNHAKSTAIPKYFNAPKEKLPIEIFIKELLSKEGKWYNEVSFSRNKPNEKFNYSNLGSTLCALIIQNATEITYKEFTQKYILDPLEMNSSKWDFKDIDKKNYSKLYATNKLEMASYHSVDYPASGLIMSSSDLGKFLQEIIKGYTGQGTLLNKNSYKELFKKQLITTQLPEGVNANVGIFMDYSKRGLGYSGYDPGLMAYMYFNPETLTGKIVIINTDTDFDEQVKPTLDKVWEVLGEYETKLK